MREIGNAHNKLPYYIVFRKPKVLPCINRSPLLLHQAIVKVCSWLTPPSLSGAWRGAASPPYYIWLGAISLIASSLRVQPGVFPNILAMLVMGNGSDAMG
jgi:hypothetical protein